MPFISTDPALLPAIERFFTHRDALANAREYEGQRRADSTKLHAELSFRPYPHGAMLCKVYGHAIIVGVRNGAVRQSGPAGTGDFIPNGSSTPLLFVDLVQCIAFILATNW